MMKSLLILAVALVAVLFACEAQACDYGQLQLSQGYCAPQQVVVQPQYVQQFVQPVHAQRVVVQRQFVHQPQQIIVNQRRGFFGLRRQQVIIR